MGIFDNSQFDPNSYGGIADWLRQAMQQGLLPNAAPSQGFAPAQPSPGLMNGIGADPAATIPPNAQPAGPAGPPMSLAPPQQQDNGGLLSSLFGNIFGGNNPQQAQPAGAPPMPAVFGPQGSSPGIGDRLSAFAHNLGASHGLIPALADAAQGLATGQRVDPQGMQQQQMRATYQALVGSGMPPNIAVAAALNPEIMKTVAPSIYTKPTWGVIGHDLTGNPQYGWIDASKQTITQPTGPNGAPASGIGFPTDPKTGEPLQGQDLLANLQKTNPAAAAMVQAIIRGDASVTGRNLQKYLPVAAMVDPTLSQFNYDARKATALDFSSKGKNGANIKSLETVGGHIEKMIESYNKLGNQWSPEYNSIKNWFNTKLGAGAFSKFETYATGVANELGTVFRSYGMSDSEINSWRKQISTSASPEQFSENMSALLDMLKTRKEAIASQYRNGMGKDLPPETFQKLDSAISQIEKSLKLPGGPTTQADPAAVEAELRRRGLLK